MDDKKEMLLVAYGSKNWPSEKDMTLTQEYRGDHFVIKATVTMPKLGIIERNSSK